MFAVQNLFPTIADVLHQVAAVSHVKCIRCALAGTVGVGSTAVPTDNVHAGMGRQPRGQRCGGPVGQQVNGPVLFRIHQDRAPAMAFAPRPVIRAQDARAGRGGALPAYGCGATWLSTSWASAACWHAEPQLCHRA
jgi:hypothetical protein